MTKAVVVKRPVKRAPARAAGRRGAPPPTAAPPLYVREGLSRITLRNWVVKYLFVFLAVNGLTMLSVVLGVVTGRVVLSERAMVTLLSVMAAQAAPLVLPVIRFLFPPQRESRKP
ncbi:MAG TPA: hypothetical protein VN282_19790 [Pyrinomonadaceae bacterium]|nr:hypothetical protein [Pyrinomonadaceae bacterium]